MATLELHVGWSKRLDVPIEVAHDFFFGTVPHLVIVMHVWLGHCRRLARFCAQSSQDCFKLAQRPVRIDQIVPVKHDCRIVVVRTDPQIVARIFGKKPPELTEEILNGIDGQLWALVSTEFRTGAGRVQDVEQLKRSNEALSESRKSRVLGLIESDTEPGNTFDSFRRKDVSVRKRMRHVTGHCFDLDGQDWLSNGAYRLARADEAFLFEHSIDIETYDRHAEKLREELTPARIDRHSGQLEELDVEGILGVRRTRSAARRRLVGARVTRAATAVPTAVLSRRNRVRRKSLCWNLRNRAGLQLLAGNRKRKRRFGGPDGSRNHLNAFF